MCMFYVSVYDSVYVYVFVFVYVYVFVFVFLCQCVNVSMFQCESMTPRTAHTAPHTDTTHTPNHTHKSLFTVVRVC